MINKIKAVVLIFCISFIGGCVGMDVATAAEAERPPRMAFVEDAGNNMYIYQDTVTGVHYLLYTKVKENTTWGHYTVRTSESAMCVLVDKDGKPLL